jgi:hypothetical protein
LWKHRDVLATLINAVSLAGLEKRERNYADANCPGEASFSGKQRQAQQRWFRVLAR